METKRAYRKWSFEQKQRILAEIKEARKERGRIREVLEKYGLLAAHIQAWEKHDDFSSY